MNTLFLKTLFLKTAVFTKKNRVMLVITLALFGLVSLGVYQWGVRTGMAKGPMSTMTDSARRSQNTQSQITEIDPSGWGVAEGEAATRRHIETGLKAGNLDPLTGREIRYYHDPMMPGKQFEAPGKSPFMDMMLVPAYAGAVGADGGTVTVSSRIQQNLGVRTGKVVAGHLAFEVSAVGNVTWNEREQFDLQARTTGFVEKLHVRAVMDRVTKGQALLDVYVPEWVAAQEDYLTAKNLRGENLQTIVAAARQRMRQVGMSETQIAVVERRQQVQPRLSLTAPATGVVTELMVREGSTVTPGMPILRINDLSTVWVHAEVPESQAAQITTGMQVIAQTPALSGEHFEGQVQTLLPEINPATRTRTVRMVLANPNDKLVPGMFVQMIIAASQQQTAQLQTALLISSEALIRTGKRTLVMVDDGDSFRPVEVQVGREHNGQSEILTGLSEGQSIVLSGQFLIDSEASLQGVEARLLKEKSVDDGAMNHSAINQSTINHETINHNTMNHNSNTAPTYRTRATVNQAADKVLTLTHPAIPDLKWPGMTMDFALSPELSSTPASGSSIDIEFQMRDDGAPLIIQWRAHEGMNFGETP